MLDDETNEKDQEPNGSQKTKDKEPSPEGGQNQKSGSTSNNSVRRVLNFSKEQLGSHSEPMECINLLKAMELNEEEDVVDLIDVDEIQISQEDEETVNLPEEWIFYIQDKRQSLLGEYSNEILSDKKDQAPYKNDDQGSSSVLSLETGGEEEETSTQPTTEDVEKLKQDDGLSKTNRGNSKNQWGPSVPLRRSSRLVDDGRIMMDKAQDSKRKWNLDDNPGINSKSQSYVSVVLLQSVAKDIGIAGLDGNPKVLDNMISLDNQRNSAYR